MLVCLFVCLFAAWWQLLDANGIVSELPAKLAFDDGIHVSEVRADGCRVGVLRGVLWRDVGRLRVTRCDSLNLRVSTMKSGRAVLAHGWFAGVRGASVRLNRRACRAVLLRSTVPTPQYRRGAALGVALPVAPLRSDRDATHGAVRCRSPTTSFCGGSSRASAPPSRRMSAC